LTGPIHFRGEAGDGSGAVGESATGISSASAAPGLAKFQKELSAGIVSLVLLSLLEQAGEPLYGYQIAKRLEGGPADGLPLKQGTLYPVLRSLEAGSLLASRVEPSVTGPPRRYYTITDLGREALSVWRAAWEHSRDFVDAVLEGHFG
jgi:PadR family transcriptional regulator, regulatory protein PadR